MHHLRVRTGVETLPGDVLEGRATRYRPVVNITGSVGDDEQFTGDWMNDEREAFAAARELGEMIRKRLAEKHPELKRDPFAGRDHGDN